LKEKVMANPFGMGLPNQGLKSLTASATSTVLETIPVEFDAAVILAAAEVNLVATQTVANNRKITLDSLIVNVSRAETVVTLYRNAVVVASWTPKTVDQSIQLFTDGIGREFDEAETWRITMTAAGAGTAHGSVSGRSEIKRNELFSQILA
jgi:hypothetical protein